MEAIHAAAYHHNTLGLPLYPTEGGLEKFNHESLQEYFHSIHLPQRSVVSGVGVDHAEFVSLVREHFKTPRGKDPKVAKAVYTGGSVNQATDSETLHFALAFQSGSWHSKDLETLCTLQLLAGGGGSFSAGGPGKGMCSRLYANVMNQYEWLESANAHVAHYTDSGLFVIAVSCHGEMARDVVEIVCREFIGLKKITKGELERAKAQLKSSMLMQLELRTAQVEDIGRQVLTFGRVDTVASLLARIDKVTVEDAERVVSSFLKGRPAMAAVGNIAHMPRFEEVEKVFA